MYIKINIYLFIIILYYIILYLYHRYWALSKSYRIWSATNPQSEIVTTIYYYDICIYKDWLKSSQAHQDILMECDQIRFIFQYSPPCSPLTSSISVVVLGSHWSKMSSTADHLMNILAYSRACVCVCVCVCYNIKSV